MKKNLGPAIAVEFIVDHKKIQKINLRTNEAAGLVWNIQGDKSLQSLIDAWMLTYLNRTQPEIILPLDWKTMPPYTTQVLHTIHALSFGKTLSYLDIAKKTQRPRAYRAVGTACGKNPFPLVIPCHRILAEGKRIGGFTGGIEIKKRLLNFENIFLAEV